MSSSYKILFKGKSVAVPNVPLKCRMKLLPSQRAERAGNDGAHILEVFIVGVDLYDVSLVISAI